MDGLASKNLDKVFSKLLYRALPPPLTDPIYISDSFFDYYNALR